MKRHHFFRSFALIGIGAVGLAMLVPSPDGAVTQVQRSSVAASPKLLNYLEAQLRPVTTGAVLRTDGPSPKNALLGSQPAVERTRVAAPMVVASTLGEFNSQSSTALNVRAGPDQAAGRLFVLRAGASVRIDEIKGDWAKILTADGKSGWVYEPHFAQAKPQLGADGDGLRVAVVASQASTGSIAVAAPAAPGSSVRQLGTEGDVPSVAIGQGTDPKARTKVKAFLLANDTVMRSSPSKGSTKISVIQGGSKLLVAEWDRSWARVILSDGTTGWINAR